MCEYISHLNKFKKYRYTCKRNTKEILESKKNSYAMLLKCLALDNLDSYTVYVFYRTENIIDQSIRLYVNKEEVKIKRLEDLKSTIIQGSEGYLEFYVFNVDDKENQKQFEKLYQLINESCEPDKINSDFDSKFIHNISTFGTNFLLSSYEILGKYFKFFISISLVSLIMYVYSQLINNGYPSELIDYKAIISIAEFLVYRLNTAAIFVSLVVIIIISYVMAYDSNLLGVSKTKFKRRYKIIFMFILYLYSGFIVSFLGGSIFHNQKLFLQIYQDIHFFPRLIQQDNHIFYVLGREKRVTYAYKLDDLLHRKQIENICKELSNGKDFYSLGKIIMSLSANIKNIHIMPINNATEYLDVNDSTQLVQKEYCQ